MPALVTTVREATPETVEDVWSEAAWLPCTLSVDLSLCRFTVRDLLQLEVGAILETDHVNGSDVRVGLSVWSCRPVIHSISMAPTST